MDEWRKMAEAAWNDKADLWNSNSVEMWNAGSRKDIIPFFKEFVPEEGHIGDLGCGDGYGSYLLSQNGYRVTGMDLSPRMIELANQNQSENERLSFIQGDLTNPPFKEAQLDGIMAINSLEWTKDPLSVLKEIHRITKPESYALFGILGPTAHPRKNSFGRLRGEKVICNTMMPWEFEQLAQENGWKKIAEHHVYKRGVDTHFARQLSSELKQALTFMTLFMLQKQNLKG
ncbi:class I SAM-dependent methyltransferase [Falsibacillus albus]|uniref:Class I SAM-dependent methyltransferase n=2 Tax=Falsibacillus albus TaxID=2478915 RepID=A0A3L7JY74_9BACI|nr:class I SAM-dependent methyltransferase [Falsibacillus albus]